MPTQTRVRMPTQTRVRMPTRMRVRMRMGVRMRMPTRMRVRMLAPPDADGLRQLPRSSGGLQPGPSGRLQSGTRQPYSVRKRFPIAADRPIAQPTGATCSSQTSIQRFGTRTTKPGP
jgi:hypothetical protein